MIVAAMSTTNEVALGLIAAAFVVFALVSAMVIPRSRPDFPRNVRAFVAVTVVFFGVTLFAVFQFAKESHGAETAAAGAPAHQQAPTTTSAGVAQADLVSGKKVFQTAGCESCHTLKDAGATATVGPNLDEVKPSEQLVETQVTNGGAIMPSFRGRLTGQQIKDVAGYVASVAGKS